MPRNLFEVLLQRTTEEMGTLVTWAEFWYNTTFRISINTTPFNVVYGRQPPPIISYGDKKTTNNTVEQQLIERDKQLLILKEHLRLSQERMKKQVDKHRREVEFDEGDMVYLKLRPYRQKSLAKRCEKLAPRYFGSYKILEKIGVVAYRLDLPPEACIHDVIHVSQLKKVVGQQIQVQSSLPTLSDSFEWVIEPEEVLGIRWNTELEEEQWLVK